MNRARPVLHGVAVGVALLQLSLQLSCTTSDATDLQPPAGYAPTFHPLRGPVPRGTRVGFGDGFFEVESDAAGTTWRWMSKRGTIHLSNDRHDKHLHLTGWVPLELLDRAPTVRIVLNEVVLDQFVASDGHLVRDYAVASTRLGAAPVAELTLETSATVHAPGDTRELGISILTVGWRDAPGSVQPMAPAGTTLAP